MPESSERWLLLLHQVPPTPPYFQIKAIRRLNQLALAIKNSANVLSEDDDNAEDFHWLRSEMAEGRGEAWLLRAEPLSGLSDAALISSFKRVPSEEHTQLLQEAEAAYARLKAAAKG